MITFLSHPEVDIVPSIPIPLWHLSEIGSQRVRALLNSSWHNSLTHIYSSPETKAMDMAEILAKPRDLTPVIKQDLAEIDRSSTGYLPLDAFERVADACFASPHESIQGWERAIDAQERIVRVLEAIVARHTPEDSLVLCSHGGVGAFLLAHLLGKPINRSLDQPGKGGGNFFVIDHKPLKVLQTWQPMENVQTFTVPK